MSGEASRNYHAPALEKGLDILELLAGEPGGVSQTGIAQRLGRSVGEIFRVLNHLERRGYVQRAADSGLYGLSLRLFELAHRFPPTRRLLDVALPEMRHFAAACEQSCHLSLEDGGRLVVIADVESPGPANYSIRVGTRFPFAKRASSYVLAAFAPGDRRAPLAAALLAHDADARARDALDARLALVRARGYEQTDSETVHGIIDVSFPIFDHRALALAALTAPVVPLRERDPDLAAVRRHLSAAATRISGNLGFVAPPADDGA